jgi:hypothetical protein
MKLIDILSDINPILRILLVIVLAMAAIFIVKTIRRLSQYLLTMKVDSKETSQEILTRRYPKLATIITILVSAVTFTIQIKSGPVTQKIQCGLCLLDDYGDLQS